jgi:hypothetical protein
VDQLHGSGGPQPGGGSRVHGGPRAAAAERLTGARARGCFGEQKLVGGGENEEETSGDSYRGWVTVNCNGGGLELGVGRVEARRGEIEIWTRCGGVLRC